MIVDAIDDRYELAKALAKEAGELAVQMRKDKGADFASRKSHQDFVTAADVAVEELIRSRILHEFPGDSILGEEGGSSGSGDAIWVVDPIDGTTNYMHGMPEWAVSIGYCAGQDIKCGAIYAPDIATLVSARTGMGAQLNARVARVSGCDSAENALVLLGRSARHGAKDYVTYIQQLLDRGMEYRRNGSAAYSLLAVAAGRAEAFFEAHLNPWDAMAGLLIVQEAGGVVETPQYGEFLKNGGPVLASNSSMHNKVKLAIANKSEN